LGFTADLQLPHLCDGLVLMMRYNILRKLSHYVYCVEKEGASMFLIHRITGDLINIEDIDPLLNPHAESVWGKNQAGEEEQEAREFSKKELLFPSGEELPRCWEDINYHVMIAGIS
jgi:hypothetical protein